MRARRTIAATVLLTLAVAACSSSGGETPGLSPSGTTTGGSGGARSASSGAAPATDSGPPGATSSEVSFNVNGSKTYGTLEVPPQSGGQRLAAALLISGSGPNDRNGNDPALNVGADTLQLLADILARQGIMTLRFDKYGAGKTGPASVATQDLTTSTYFRQADAAYDLLAHLPQVDPVNESLADEWVFRCAA